MNANKQKTTGSLATSLPVTTVSLVTLVAPVSDDARVRDMEDLVMHEAGKIVQNAAASAGVSGYGRERGREGRG